QPRVFAVRRLVARASALLSLPDALPISGVGALGAGPPVPAPERVGTADLAAGRCRLERSAAARRRGSDSAGDRSRPRGGTGLDGGELGGGAGGRGWRRAGLLPGTSLGPCGERRRGGGLGRGHRGC